MADFNIYDFDKNHIITPKTIVLCNRAKEKLGCIPFYEEFSPDFSMNSHQSLTFIAHKYSDMELCNLWDKIETLQLIYIPEYHEYYQIEVSINESESTTKRIDAVSLCEAELSNLYIYNTEINTEADIIREDYLKPTIIYDPSDIKNSLLHRILKDKAPHYIIEHVDISIAKKQRSFSIDGESICDFLVSTLSEELECLVKFNSETRGISLYDLNSFCMDCGAKIENETECPKCNSHNISKGYGNDTTIFISKDNLAQNIILSVDKDSIKNRLRVIGGDSLMTATVAACNPSGNNYITNFSQEQKRQMSEALQNALDNYDIVYEENTKPYQQIMFKVYELIDKISYLTSVKMPDVEITPDTNAATELAKLTSNNIGTVAVTDLIKASGTTVNNTVLSMAKLFISRGYTVAVPNYIYDKENHQWSGFFTVTRNNDKENTATSTSPIIIEINDDYENFIEQKIKKALLNSKENDSVLDPELTLEQLIKELKRYCLNRLISFESAYQSCIDILIQMGVGDENAELYEKFYKTWHDKLLAIQDEIKIVEVEIKHYEDELDLIEIERNKIQKKLDLETFLGNDLWIEYCSHIREDTYSNDNYISEGLTNTELFDKAKELLEVSTRELYKASTFQYSISSTISNLLTIPEFEPLKSNFKLGNWIRIQIDDNIYKLRLINIKPNMDDSSELEVEFSDITKIKNGTTDAESIIKRSQSIATSYPFIMRQAKQGGKSYEKLNDMQKNALNATNIKVVNSDKQKVVFDEHGILCREFDDELNDYSPYQLKIINDMIAYTNNNWESVKTALGRLFIDDEELYGLIADIMVAGRIIGTIISGSSITGTTFDNGNGTFSLDENGHLTVSSIEVTGGKIKIGDFIVDESGFATIGEGDFTGKFSGEIEANDGLLAGWKLSEDCLYKNSPVIGEKDSMYFGDNGLSIRDSFIVSETGHTTISDGLLGDWTVSGDGLSDGTLVSSDLHSKIQVSSAQIKSNTNTDEVKFVLGYDSDREYGFLNFPSLSNGSENLSSFDNTLLTQGLVYTNGNVVAKNQIGQLSGNSLMSMYGTSLPLFGDIGHGTIGADGTAKISFESEFFKTVDTSKKYYISITPYSNSVLYVSDTESDHFVVTGDTGVEFDWEIKAVQKGKTKKIITEFSQLFMPKEKNGQ